MAFARIKTYGFGSGKGYSAIDRNLAGAGGYQGYQATPKKPRVISYLSQGATAPRPKATPLASTTPGYGGPTNPDDTPRAAPIAAPAAPAPAPTRETAPRDPNVNYESDPILQKIRKAAQGQRDTAQSAARTRKVQLATQLGDTGFARELGLSDAETAAAAANPLSDLALLGRTEEKSTATLEDALNKANLYFGGHRGTQLGELAQNFLGQRAGALGAARQGYAGILGDLLSSEGDADRMELEADAAAYGRELDRQRAGGAGAPAGPAGPGTPPPLLPPDGPPPGTPPPLLPPGGGDPVRGAASIVSGFGGATDPNDPLRINLLAGRARPGAATAAAPLAQGNPLLRELLLARAREQRLGF